MRIERESRESDISASYASSLDSFACPYLRSFALSPPFLLRGHADSFSHHLGAQCRKCATEQQY